MSAVGLAAGLPGLAENRSSGGRSTDRLCHGVNRVRRQCYDYPDEDHSNNDDFQAGLAEKGVVCETLREGQLQHL